MQIKQKFIFMISRRIQNSIVNEIDNLFSIVDYQSQR